MSDIEKRLRASVGFDAINGDRMERSVCGKQMLEAATAIVSLRTQLAAVTAERDAYKTDALRYRLLKQHPAWKHLAGDAMDKTLDAISSQEQT